MKNEFALAFNEVLEEKGLPRETILEALGQALVSAYRKSVNASNAQEVKVVIDLDKGVFRILTEKEVVESVQNDLTEVSLKTARKFNADAQVGELVMVDNTPENFGRVAAQNARQVIQQKIRDAENAAQLEYYEKQLGEIISGIVQAANSQGLTVGLELGAEGVMPRKEMIPFEHFRIHERVRSLVAEIKESGRGPQIILSRTHRDFLRRLLENEVPEIYHGVVEIRSIAREPGQRAKVAVSAAQKGIDPVGACVGMRGVRIQAIVRELHDEKIDVIEWSNDPTVFIAKSISPARVNGVYLKESIERQKNALVVVPEDQLSLAIGRDGQNARLAAKLTGWRIDIKSLPEAVSDWLFALQNKEELKEQAKEEKEAIKKAEDILARKAEGRVINPEDYDFLVDFNDRMERYASHKMQAKIEKYKAKRQQALQTIPEGAIRVPLEETGLTANIIEALREAGYENAGDLVLASKLNPEDLLEVSGIGPKTLERIQEFEKALPALIPATEEVAVYDEEPLPSETEPEEKILEPVDSTMIALEEEAAIEPSTDIEIDETGIKEQGQYESMEDIKSEETLSFDEMFKLKPEVFNTGITAADDDLEETVDDDEGEKPGKKKAKKSKKHRELEYDPDLDLTIAKKKHKRGEEDWGEI